MLIAAVTMDLAGRKILLYVSGECLHRDLWATAKPLSHMVQDVANGNGYTVMQHGLHRSARAPRAKEPTRAPREGQRADPLISQPCHLASGVVGSEWTSG